MITKDLPGYELLDSGLGKKLEIISGIKVVRPSPQAIWKPRLPMKDWEKATSVCHRSKDGGGKWEHLKNPPEQLFLNYQLQNHQLKFKLKFTSFGHCGVFLNKYLFGKLFLKK